MAHSGSALVKLPNEVVSKGEVSQARTGLTISEMKEIARALAASGYFSTIAKPEQAFAKILYGAELGIGPMAAIAGVHIVEGKPSLDASLVGARIKQSGRYDYKIRRTDSTGCSIEFFERGESLGIASFVETDAEAAGLIGKSNWKKYARAMYRSRAMTEGARAYCPDVFNGAVYTPDELRDVPNDAPPTDFTLVEETLAPVDVTPQARPSDADARVVPDQAAADIPPQGSDGPTLRAWIGKKLAFASKNWTGKEMALACSEVAAVLGRDPATVTPKTLAADLVLYRDALAAPGSDDIVEQPAATEDVATLSASEAYVTIEKILAERKMGETDARLQELVATASEADGDAVIYAWPRLKSAGLKKLVELLTAEVAS